MPELLQQKPGSKDSSTKITGKQVINVKEDSTSELEVESEQVEKGLKVDLTERTITQRIEKFRENGEEKKLVDIDENEETRSNLIKKPGERYNSVMPHPLSLVPQPEPQEVDFSPAMQRLKLFNMAVPVAEPQQDIEISYPEIPEQEKKQETEVKQVEQILENELEPETTLRSREQDYEQGLGTERRQETETYEENTANNPEAGSIPEADILEETPENSLIQSSASIELEEAALEDPETVAFDVTGYDLSTLIEEYREETDGESPLLQYIDEEGLEQFTLLDENLLHAGYMPEQTEEGIHQRLVYQVEDQLNGSTVKQVAEHLTETMPVNIEVEAQTFYSDEKFEMGGEVKEPGEYTVHGFDVEEMDENMTEYRVNNELAEDAIDHVEVETGDYVDFVEADVYSGHR